MWEINSDGNAYNNLTGESIRVVCAVIHQERGCGGHRTCLKEFEDETNARRFLKRLVDKLNTEETT